VALVDSGEEHGGRSLIRSDLDFFAPCLPAAISDEDYKRDWDRVMRLAQSDGLLPEEALHYPLIPAVSGLDPSVEGVWVERLHSVVEAVERVAKNYVKDVELQHFLNLPPSLHEYALADTCSGRYVDYCRFDLAGDQLDNIRVLEVNGCFPGLSNTGGLLNRYWRQTSTVGPLVDRYPPAQIEEPGWLVGELLKVGAMRELDVDNVNQIALLSSEEAHALPESLLIKKQVRHHCRTPICMAADQPLNDDTPLGLLMYPNLPFVENPGRYDAVLKRVASGELIALNGILGRAVGGCKLTLAVLSDPRFQRFFTADQVATINSLIPWSRKLDDGATIHETRAQRAELVLKAPHDFMSQGVYIGCSLSPDQWRRLVNEGARQGWLVQEFVPPQRFVTESGYYYRTLGAAFVAGRVAGYTARLSPSLLGTFIPEGGMHAVFGSHSHVSPASHTLLRGGLTIGVRRFSL
jgi:hypothetical protein